MSEKNKKIRIIGIVIFLYIGVLLFWQSNFEIIGIERWLLPAPSEIIKSFFNNFSMLMEHTWATFIVSLLGFIIEL